MAENSMHHDSRSHAVFAVTLAITVCSFVFVFFRMVSRIGIVGRVQWDDYFMIVAWIIGFGLSFSICYGTSVGLGTHEIDIPASSRQPLQKSEYAFAVLYNPALMATKTSILVFYLSLSRTHRIFRWLTIGTLFVVNAAGIALTFLSIFQCHPFGAVFETTPPPSAHCIDVIGLFLSSSPVNLSTDLAMLFLPMPILTAMRLPKKQKIILVITFGFGIFVAAVDVVRIAYLQQASYTRLEDMHSNAATQNAQDDDFSWYASYSYMWSAVEVNVGIMCGCVPGLKPLVSRFLPYMLRDASEHTVNGPSEEPVDMITAQQIRDNPPSRASEEEKDEGPEGPMGMIDFLTTPDMTEIPAVQRSDTAMTNKSGRTAESSPRFFDFVNMRRNKSMVHLTNKESIFPLSVVTFLFLVWGFAYGLLDVLNSQVQLVAHMSAGRTIGLHSAYYGGYFLAPVTFGRLCLKHWGFKACYTVGLIIYAVGTLVFWPASVLTSFPAFIVSNLIVGLGLSTLEIAANPFIALCGPAQYAEIRLNLSQGVQAIATIFAPLLAKKVLFRNVLDAPSLVDVQWTYLSIALFVVLLAVAYHYIPLPEATDDELADVSERADSVNDSTFTVPFNLPNLPFISSGQQNRLEIKTFHLTLALAVLSQFCYVGAQESVNTSFPNYVATVLPDLNTDNHQAIGHAAFAIGRFVAAFFSFFVKPRYILLFCHATAIIFAALCMNFSGDTPAALVIIVYLFEGPLFSLIFVAGLRGAGKNTKTAAAYLTSAISGGAVFPPIFHAVQKGHGDRVQYAYCVVVAAFAGGAVLAVWVNGVRRARRIVDFDGTEESELVRNTRRNERPGSENSESERRVKRWSKKIKRWSWKSGVDGGRESEVEHVERKNS
ncbi:MAG: hypothetical protein M1820_009775 [Bogoriella megaspora]|nr:MAG: hypothetical protein M1820_009775 [Bogoriella megaspora]